MKKFLLAATAASALFATSLSADTDVYEDPEMQADAFDARMQEVEWALRNNPVLMQEAVSEALRSNPSVVQEIIRDTLLRNPEIIIGSLQEFQRKQQAGAAAAVDDDEKLSAELLMQVRKSEDAPVRGNPKGTVTIVEFSDYNCGYCRAFGPILDELIASNDDLRVIHREWPILSSESVEVAKLALAAQQQGAYEKMHVALMNASGTVDKGRALKIAGDLGLDTEKLEADSEDPRYWTHIQKSAGFAEKMGLRGTPGILIGDELARGLVGADKIQPILDRLKID